MNLLFKICIALSNGIVIGFLLGGMKYLYHKDYSRNRTLAAKKFINALSIFLKYITLLMLTLGLIWCLYFLVLGAMDSNQTEYANNMAELIVAVLTVISIIFAFFEFIRRDDKKIES